MASFRAAAFSSASASSGSTSVTAAAPVNINGDLMLAFIWTDITSATFTVPGTWGSAFGPITTAGGTAAQYSWTAASEPASYPITLSGSTYRFMAMITSYPGATLQAAACNIGTGGTSASPPNFATGLAGGVSYVYVAHWMVYGTTTAVIPPALNHALYTGNFNVGGSHMAAVSDETVNTNPNTPNYVLSWTGTASDRPSAGWVLTPAPSPSPPSGGGGWVLGPSATP